LALKWWAVTDIVSKESETTRQKAENVLADLQRRQQARREQDEIEALEKKEARTKLSSNWLEAQLRVRAADDIKATNELYAQLGLPDQIPFSESAISQQIRSGGTWAQELGKYAEQQIAQGQQEAEQELRADVTEKLLKDGLITVGTPEEAAEKEIQAAIAARKAEDAFKQGDYANAKDWQDISDRIRKGEVVPEYQFNEELGGQELVYKEVDIPFTLTTEDGEDVELTYRQTDSTVWQDGKLVGTIDETTGEFVPKEPSVGRKILSGILKALNYVFYPFTAFGMLVWSSGQSAVQLQELAERAEQGDYEASMALQDLLGVSGHYTATDPTLVGLTREKLGVVDYTPSKEWLPGGETYEKYRELPWYKQLLYEAPAWALLGVSGGATGASARILPQTARTGVGGLLARTAYRALAPGRGLEKGLERAIGGIIRRIPPLKKYLIDKPLETSIKNYIKQQTGREATQLEINLVKDMVASMPTPQASAKLQEETIRLLAQRFGSQAVGRYYTGGRQMSEAVIKDVIAHAKKVGDTELQNAAERFLKQWLASKTAEAQAELMRGDLFIKLFGELERGGVKITDSIISEIGRMAAAEAEQYYPAAYHAALALEGQEAAHTLVVDNLAQLFNIPVADITAEVIAGIFGKGALPLTGALVEQLTNLGVTNAEKMSAEEAWAALFKGTLPKVAPTEVPVGEVTPVAPEIPTKGKIVPKTEVAETTAAAEWETTTVEAGEGEVTVEGLEPVRMIRGIQARYIQQRQDVQIVKTELTKYVKEHLPKEVQGKMLASVKNVKTDAQLRKAMDLADKYAEVAAQKTIAAQITKELRATKPTKVTTGLRYGKFTPEAQRILDGIKKNINRDRGNVQEEILKYMTAAEKGELPYDEAAEAIEILSVSGLKGMSSNEMANSLNYIKGIKATGRSARLAQREAEVARVKERIDNTIGVVTGGKGIKPGAETVGTANFEKRTGVWEGVENSHLGMDDLLDKLSKFDKASKPYQSILNQLGDNLHLSRATQISGEAYWLDKVISQIKELFDTQNRRQLNALLNQISDDKIDLGIFKNTDGVEVKLSLTRDQLIERWMQLQDPTLERTFREGMKWTDEMMAVVQDKIPEADLEIARWLMNTYQTYGKGLQPYYQAKFHMDLPLNPYYSPLSRDINSDIHEHLAFVNQAFSYSSVTSRHLKPRVRSIAPLRNDGALRTYTRFITEMEHFKAFSQSMKEARQVFGNKDVKTAIRQYHGNNILKYLNKHLDDIARDGIDKAKVIHWLDVIRRNFTVAVLVSPAVSLRQIVSLPAYMLHDKMPIKDFFEGVTDFWKNPIQNYRMLKAKSPYLNERWGAGYERDVKLVMQKGWQGKLSQRRNWRDHLMIGIRFFDTAATVQGSYAVYKSMLKQKYTEEQAILEAELATKRTQPSFGLEDMAALRKEGSMWSLFTMFMSQPNKYFRIIAQNARNLKYGRGDKKRALFHLIMAWAVLPMVFQWMADAFQWKKERQLRAAVLGPINFMFVAGDIAQHLWGWASGDQEFQYQGSPIFSTINELAWALGRTTTLIQQGADPIKEIDPEYLIQTVEYYAQFTGKFVGVPTRYIVQIERGIRNADFRQLVFSEYSLRGTTEEEAEKKALRKLQDAFAVSRGKTKWTELTGTEQGQFWELRPDLK